MEYVATGNQPPQVSETHYFIASTFQTSDIPESLLVLLLHHAHLGVTLVSEKLGVHALGGHLLQVSDLLDSVRMGLLALIVVGVIL